LGGYLDLDPGRSRFCYGPARIARLDLDSERIRFSVSLSGNLALLAFATPSAFQMLPPDFGTGRLPAFRHALDTITWDRHCA
jgi:hypothetical protein